MKLCLLGNINGIHLRERAKAFVARGHDVRVVSSNSGQLEGVDVLTPDTPKEQSRGLKKVKNDFQRLWQLVHIISKQDADIFMVIYASGLLSWLLFALGKRPLVSVVIGSDAYPAFLGLSKAEEFLTRRLHSGSDFIVAETPYLAAELVRNGVNDEDILPIAWGVKMESFIPNEQVLCRKRFAIPASAYVIVAPRGFKDVYNPLLTVRAFAKVIDYIPNAFLVMLGGKLGEEYESVSKEVSRLNLTDRVMFLGRLSYDQMPVLLSCGDVYISTAKSDGANLSAVEAMLCDCPCVLGALPHYSGNYIDRDNVLIADHEPQALAKELTRLRDDVELRSEIIFRGRVFAESRMNFEVNVDRINERLIALVSKERYRKASLWLRVKMGLLIIGLHLKFIPIRVKAIISRTLSLA